MEGQGDAVCGGDRERAQARTEGSGGCTTVCGHTVREEYVGGNEHKHTHIRTQMRTIQYCGDSAHFIQFTPHCVCLDDMMMQVADTLDIALKNVSQHKAGAEGPLKSLIEGLDMTQNILQKTYERNKVYAHHDTAHIMTHIHSLTHTHIHIHISIDAC